MTQLLFVLLEFASQKTIICPFLKEKYRDRNTSIFTASGLLLLEQGQFVMLQRLGDLRWKICNYGYDFFKSISSSFHAFGSHQFIKDSALLLLNPLKDQSIFHFISSPFRNLTLTRHITSVYYQTIPKRM